MGHYPNRILRFAVKRLWISFEKTIEAKSSDGLHSRVFSPLHPKAIKTKKSKAVLTNRQWNKLPRRELSPNNIQIENAIKLRRYDITVKSLSLPHLSQCRAVAKMYPAALARDPPSRSRL